MDIKQLKTIVPILTRNSIVPFIWGRQGVGKTQTMAQIAKSEGIGFVHLHLATQEVGDIVGLLAKREDGTAYHTRPEWFPTSGKGILFLDELNRAHPDVIQACFSLITGKTIHMHKLPDGWSVVAAGNYQNNNFNVTDTSDQAWMSRFCHIDFDPSVEEFIVHAETNKMIDVASFIRTQPECLEVKHKDNALNPSMITPDRRSWFDMIGRLEKEDIESGLRYEIYSGIVGSTAAAAFLEHKRSNTSKLSGREVLDNYDKVRHRILKASGKDEHGKDIETTSDKAGETSRFDLLSGAVEEILTMFNDRAFESKELDAVKSLLTDVPLEMGLKIIKRLHESSNGQKNKILNDKKFIETFSRAKLKDKK